MSAFQRFTIELGWKQKIVMLSVNTDVTDSPWIKVDLDQTWLIFNDYCFCCIVISSDCIDY